MNIFILDPNPELAAIYHNDKHIVKMPLEMAQMLCTNIYYLNDLTSKAKANKNLELVYKIFKDFPPPKSSPYPFYLFAFPTNSAFGHLWQAWDNGFNRSYFIAKPFSNIIGIRITRTNHV